ncbi:hypothetical protein AJ78_05781 [Emergomyces pasteurianus Ep9510]|uniref:DUF7730 domain-containing protein n=1 Tax=Emergomyces pasteurianus Ep9510 TaxID=1447872 RepID=A0A1J9QCD2_9EURO|nr:hypothetical protein AJ78_05781 [Emergomyces pasteurianus Ep9510]
MLDKHQQPHRQTQRHAQPQSPLLGRLPFEIRCIIWTHLFPGSRNVHIIHSRDRKTKLQYVLCRENIRKTSRGHNFCKFCINAANRNEKDWVLGYGRLCGLKRSFGDLVAVGRTCWFAYCETNRHIYSAGTFIFANFSNFLHLIATSFTAQCHQHIRSVHIYWNLSGDYFVGDEEDFLIQLSVLCDAVKGLHGLRQFMVLMPPVHWYAREDMVAKVLAPLESLPCAWEMRIHLQYGEQQHKELNELRRIFKKLGWRGAVSGYRMSYYPVRYIDVL